MSHFKLSQQQLKQILQKAKPKNILGLQDKSKLSPQSCFYEDLNFLFLPSHCPAFYK